MERARITGDKLREIMTWHKKGLSCADIGSITGMSDSSVRSYVRIIEAAADGGSFRLNPKVYSESAVREFCLLIGTPVPVNTYARRAEQLSCLDEGPDPEMQVTVRDGGEVLHYDAKDLLVEALRSIRKDLDTLGRAIETLMKTNINMN